MIDPWSRTGAVRDKRAFRWGLDPAARVFQKVKGDPSATGSSVETVSRRRCVGVHPIETAETILGGCT